MLKYSYVYIVAFKLYQHKNINNLFRVIYEQTEVNF